MTLDLSPVASVSRRDAVGNEIRRAIVLGRIRPGDKLTEHGLASSLNVSRPTMREALTQLVQEGLLIQEPYRGIRVAAIDPEEIMDLARTRVALDMLAVQDILADPSGRRIAAMDAAWGDYDQLPADADPLLAHDAHITFHRRLWEASGNGFLIKLWPPTEAHLTIALAQRHAAGNDTSESRDRHAAIVNAIRGGNLLEIRAAITVHTLGAEGIDPTGQDV